MDTFQKISEYLDGKRGEMIEMQKKLTAFAAVGPDSGGPGEMKKAMWLKEWMQNNGFEDIKQYDCPDERAPEGKRPNLIAKISGKDHGRAVWVLAHTDVVPEGDRDKWETDPFEVVEKDGKLYGRGTEDNQQGLVSGLFAAKALIDLGIEPEYDLGIALVADEETGSQYGLHFLMREHGDIFGKNDIVIVPDSGNEDGTMIEVAEKSILWLKIQTFGKQCHASMPDAGINAFRAASNLVVRLHELYSIFDKQDPVFDPPGSTFEPTKKEANVPNVNTIPGDDVFYLDCRILPDYNPEEVKKEVRRIADGVEKEFNVKVEFESVQEEQAAPSTPTDAPVVKFLQKAVKEVYKVEGDPIGIGGGTFAAIFRREGIDAAVWSKLEDTCHQPNEYCVIDNMVNDAKVLAHTFLQKTE